MKTISDQLYGYRSEMGATSESNGTKCFCVDNGFTYVAFNGAWFCQSVPWCTRDPGENDLGGYSYYLPDASSVDDLVMFCAYDSGARYIAYNGHWYRQPIPWAEAPSGGGGSDLPAVTSDDNGDVLTVVGGAWAKAAPSGGADVLICDFSLGAENTCTATFAEVTAAIAAGKHILASGKAEAMFPGVVVNAAYYVSETDGGDDCVRFVFAYTTSSGGSASTTYFYALYKASGITVGMFG